MTEPIIKTAEEYFDFAEKFYQLVRTELEKMQTYNQHEIARHMPVLISLVNCVGYLRGQDGAFLDRRPSTPEKQTELYKFEDRCEADLQKMIDTIMMSPEKQDYIDRLNEYFIKARTSNSQSNL